MNINNVKEKLSAAHRKMSAAAEKADAFIKKLDRHPVVFCVSGALIL